MKHFIALIAALALCASCFGQAIKPISYNSSNNIVIGATNSTNALQFSNAFKWSTNTLASATRSNLSLGWSALTNSNAATALLGVTTNGQVIYSGTNALTFTNNVGFNYAIFSFATISNADFYALSIADNTNSAIYFEGNSAATTRTNLGIPFTTAVTNTNAAGWRSALGLGATWLTNTNVTNFRTAIGLGTTNSVTFETVSVGSDLFVNGTVTITADNGFLTATPITFTTNDAKDQTRLNLSLGLPALTNTSNVTMMRALSGSTNTNHPYNGSISVTGTNNTNTLVFSNGILQFIQ